MIKKLKIEVWQECLLESIKAKFEKENIKNDLTNELMRDVVNGAGKIQTQKVMISNPFSINQNRRKFNFSE